MTIVTKTATSTTRTQRYRELHRRFDYVPADDVLPIIEYYLSKYPNQPMNWTLDALVRTANTHVQNLKNKVPCNSKKSQCAT